MAQRALAEQHQPGVVRLVCEAVVGRFADHVCEVDALAEHVARHWRLGGRDPQALGDDPHVVGQP